MFKRSSRFMYAGNDSLDLACLVASRRHRVVDFAAVRVSTVVGWNGLVVGFRSMIIGSIGDRGWQQRG